ncbi:MAG: hypothetical protein QOH96_1082 [Blastocatellia bacterium]|nr:hypothetical protein [Blastocatellia bacterium]
MRFEYFNETLTEVPKLSVDGLVENAIHFSHWAGNLTDASVKADTSTEIALNVVESNNREELTKGIDLVTNNHFDTDGLLSVWTLLTGPSASELRHEIISAAEAGDFSEFPNKNAVRASIVIQGSEFTVSDDGVSSPLAIELNGGLPVTQQRAYELLLPEVRNVFLDLSLYEALWRDDWARIETALNSFASGLSRVTEYNDSGLSLVTMDATVYSDSGFKPTCHLAPYTAVAHNARGNLFLIAAEIRGGWSYRVDYPYYSWAETVVRPRIRRYDFSELIANLNLVESEKAGGRNLTGFWRADHSGLTSAIKFVSEPGEPTASRLDPLFVAGLFDQTLKTLQHG